MRTALFTRSTWVGLALLALGGCAHENVNVAPLPANADPSREISDLGNALSVAKANQIDLLSPHYFALTQDSLNQAVDRQRNGKSNTNILQKVAEARAYLNKAMGRADVSRALMKDVQSARNDALAVDAPKFFPKDFSEADQHFKDAATKIEQENATLSDRDRGLLVRDYRVLSANASREGYLGEPQRLVKQAKDEGAQDLAPKTLKDAEQAVSKVESGIKSHADPHDLKAMSDEAMQKSQFLLKVTREAKLVKRGNPEDTVLGMEKQRQEISQLGEESASKEANLEKQKGQIGSLQQEAAFSQKFSQIRGMFSSDEADVLRTDHQIVIRLKGLHFPTAGSEIPSQDFALLGRVRDAIAALGRDNKVTVEGHTDATGSKKTNEELSLERAQSVRDYLTSSRELPPENFEVQGKGFSQPIASDRTKSGRALNRRVDVVIESMAG